MNIKYRRGEGLKGLDGLEGKASKMRNPKRVTVLFTVQYQAAEHGSLKGPRL